MLAAVGVVCVLAACSEDEDARKPPPGSGGADASEAASGRGGSGGSTGGSGGSSAGSGGAAGTGGTVGTTGMIDAAPDVVADAGDAAPDGSDAGDAALACSPREGGADSGGTWRDHAAGICKACPTEPLTCADLLGPPESVLDTRTGIATIHLTPGRAEVVSGTWDLNYQGELEGGSVLGSTTATFQVNGNTLSANLKQVIPDPVDSVTWVYGSNILLDDACGVRHQASTGGVSLDFSLTSPDGGETILTARCVTD